MGQTGSPETLVSYQKKLRTVETQKPLYNITTAVEAFNHMLSHCYLACFFAPFYVVITRFVFFVIRFMSVSLFCMF
jgi:hypothetical protein